MRGPVLLYCCLISVGCRRDMQDQPKMKPYRGTSFFGDGRRCDSRSRARFRVANCVLIPSTTPERKQMLPRATATPATQQQTAGAQANYISGRHRHFSVSVRKKSSTAGRERYDIFCSACHGLTGNGDGMIVRRGFRRAASFNDDRLRQAPVGHFFDAITNGWGAMPSYASQIPVQDRWAIITYIRALQLSQQNNAAAAASPAPQLRQLRRDHQPEDTNDSIIQSSEYV